MAEIISKSNGVKVTTKTSKVVEDPQVKKLKVQVSVCKRMLKEVASYEKEVLKNEERVQKMRDDGKNIYDIKKQEEVLQESYMMIPDSKSRLEKAVEELALLLEDITEESKFDPTILLEAKQIVLQFNDEPLEELETNDNEITAK